MSEDNDSSLLAPNEGTASTHKEIADELSEILVHFDHIDYNAPHPNVLEELLEARDTINELCLQYREDQHAAERSGTKTETAQREGTDTE